MAAKAKLIQFLAAGLEDTNGNPLSGYKVRTYAADGTTAKVVWEDRDKTLPSGAGKSAFTLDTTGRAVVYGDGVYVIKVWTATADPDTDSPYKTYPAANYRDDDALSADITAQVGTLAELRAFDRQSVVEAVYMRYRTTAGDGGHGWFRWDASDLSASVPADTLSGIYVAPTSDPTGTSGAWVRQYSGAADPFWFGMPSDGATDGSSTVIGMLAAGVKDIKFSPLSAGYVLNQTIPITSSNITIDFDKAKVSVTVPKGWIFFAYPPALQSIYDGTGRPAGFETGIDNDFRTIMYEETDRLENITIKNANWVDTVKTTGGRMAIFTSCDNCAVIDSQFDTYSAPVETFHGKGFKFTGNIVNSQFYGFYAHKSKKVRVHRNNFNSLVGGVDLKGHYHQPGKTIYQGFDAGYVFNAESMVTNNIFSNTSLFGVQAGYYDNSGNDISSGAAVGVTKRDWYGEQWNVLVEGNTFRMDTIPASDSSNRAWRANINSKHQKFINNTVYDMCVEVIGGSYNDIRGNKIYGNKTTSSGSVIIRGVSLGGEAVNSEYNTVEGNSIIGGTTTAPLIDISGGNFNTAKKNHLLNWATGTVGVMVRNTTIQAPYTKSSYNLIDSNTLHKVAVNFNYPISCIENVAAYNTISRNIASGGWYSVNSDDFTSGAHYQRGVVRGGARETVDDPGTNYIHGNKGDIGSVASSSGNADPTFGTWHRPEIIWNQAAATAGKIGRVVATGGTFGTLTGVTGDITTGTAALTVNDASGLTVGEYISIAGVTGTKRISAISGPSVTIDSNANATVAGAAVAYVAPTFKTFGLID